MSEDAAPAVSREEAEAIATAYCANSFPYDYPDTAEGRAQKARHLAYDVENTADQIMGGMYRAEVAIYLLGKEAAP